MGICWRTPRDLRLLNRKISRSVDSLGSLDVVLIMSTSRKVETTLHLVMVRNAGQVSWSTPMEWRLAYGKPTTDCLKAYVQKFEASCAEDGCNSHFGPTIVTRGEIRRNGKIVVEYNSTIAPLA